MIRAHSRFLELAATSIDFELSRAEHEDLEAHFASCGSCRGELRALRGDARTIASLPLRRRSNAATTVWSGRGGVPPSVLRLVFVAALLALLVAGVATVGSELLRRAPTIAPSDDIVQATTSLPPGSYGSWQPAAPLSIARALHTSTLLGDGRVLVVGGASGRDSLRSTEIFDPEGAVWSVGPDMADARSSHVAFPFFDEATIVAGGYGLPGEAIAGVESFVDGAWELAPPFVEARAEFAAVLQAPRGIAFIGGYGPGRRALGSMEILDLDTSAAMVPAASMSTPRARPTATTLFDLRILVAGGVRDDGVPLASAELYDPTTGTWRTVAPMHEPRVYHTAVRLNDDRILVAGGQDAFGRSLDTAELYDATADTWSIVQMPEARDRHGATMFSGSTVLIVGGERDGVSLATTAVFDPSTDTWTAGPALHQPRSYVSLVRLESGAVMVVGGAWTGASALTDVEILDPLARP